MNSPWGPERVAAWATLRPARRVLFIVHTVASANRLTDYISLFDSDLRVQLVFTCPDESAMPSGVAEYFREFGAATIPWQEATAIKWDLAITANTRGDLHKIAAPLIVVSHGVGYSKNIPESRKVGKSESRKAGKPESRKAGKPESRKAVYGLSPESLLRASRVVPDVLVLSHDEQVGRLAASVPEALDRAVVAGDPRYDRILGSRTSRQRFRAALGVDENDVLVVVTTTWWSRSLFGTWPDLLRQLMAELPVDGYRVAAVLHPHVWHEHGPGQVESWLADCLRAGLILVPAIEGWAATLVASDVVVGDHGAVTCYGAALDKPVLLAAFPTEDVATGSCVEQLGLLAPRLVRGRRLRDQVDEAREQHEPDAYAKVADLVSSHPGDSSSRLRVVVYDLMGLPEPPQPVVLPLLPLPNARSAPYLAVRVSGEPIGPDAFRIRRHAADALTMRGSVHPILDDAHLVADATHPAPVIRGNADIVFTREATSPSEWLREAMIKHPFAHIAAVATEDRCMAAVRGGPVIALTRVTGTRLDPLVAVSALYLWLTHNAIDSPLPRRLVVQADRAGEAVFALGSQNWSALGSPNAV